MVGTATFIEPIITEWVTHPTMSERLMAQRAEGAGAPGGVERAAVRDWVAGVRGARATGVFLYLVVSM